MARRTKEIAATAETANEAQAATIPATTAPTPQTTAPTINIFNETPKPATRKRSPRRTRFDEDDDEPEMRTPYPEPTIIPQSLTDDEGDEGDEPLDPLTEFLMEFRDYQGTVSITRLVDPVYMREAARIGRRDAPNIPCVEPIPYPRFPFNPETFVSDIQMLTGSGGRYRAQLHNTRGHYERGSAWTGVVPNPSSLAPAQTLPAATAPAPQPPAPAPAPTPEPKIDPFQEAVNNAVRAKIKTLFDPPAPPPAPTPAPAPLPDPIREAVDEAYKKKIVDFVSGVTSGGSGDAPASNFDRVINLVERNPSIIRSLDSKVNRVLDYFVPGDAETTLLADQVLDLARERCAANEPLAFDDPLLVEMREREPSQYEDLIFNLNNGSVEQIAQTFTAIDESFALVMKAPHSRAWIEGLKELAASAAKQLEAAK